MDELRDIKGLQEISWLPLAPGWWIVIAGIIVLLSLLIGVIIYYRRRPPKLPLWQTVAMQEWSILQEVTLPKRKDVTQLAELLRRVAIQRYGRESCAGLVGQHWLIWLAERDSQQFDWQTAGRLLLEVPYLPEENDIDPHQFKLLLIAVRHWI